jgi:hypothetical protein
MAKRQVILLLVCYLSNAYAVGSRKMQSFNLVSLDNLKLLKLKANHTTHTNFYAFCRQTSYVVRIVLESKKESNQLISISLLSSGSISHHNLRSWCHLILLTNSMQCTYDQYILSMNSLKGIQHSKHFIFCIIIIITIPLANGKLLTYTSPEQFYIPQP